MNYTSAESGLDRGFAHYEDHELSPAAILRGSALGGRVIWEVAAAVGDRIDRPIREDERKDAARVSGQLLDWLAQRREGRPFFAFLNYFDAHNDYIPPRSFQRRFGVRPETVRDENVLVDWFYLDKKTLNPREIRLANDGYDDCIAYLDEQLGRLLCRS